METEPHYYVKGPAFGTIHPLCTTCGQSYADGDHIEITTLKAFTGYHCATPGCGKASKWTGANNPIFRTPTSHLCIVCGEPLTEDGAKTTRVLFELQREDGEWHVFSRLTDRHDAERQLAGLLELIEKGEPIRNAHIEGG